MPAKVDDLTLRVEAILFAGGKPLAVREVTEILGTADHRKVQQALKTLVRTYSGRQTALELKRVGDRYALQLREQYVPVARPVTPMEMAPRTLKALTLIAYHQPMRQSFLVRIFGETTYEEVQRLRDLGLIHADAKGSTLELRTTRAFAEYFGIGSTKPEEIRAYLERKVGVRALEVSASPEGAPGDPSPGPVPDGAGGTRSDVGATTEPAASQVTPE